MRLAAASGFHALRFLQMIIAMLVSPILTTGACCVAATTGAGCSAPVVAPG